VAAEEGACWVCWQACLGRQASRGQTAADTGRAGRRAPAGNPAVGEVAGRGAARARSLEVRLLVGRAALGVAAAAAVEDSQDRDGEGSWKAMASAGTGPAGTLADPRRRVGTLAEAGTALQGTGAG
jgi:hypothetical protein